MHDRPQIKRLPIPEGAGTHVQEINLYLGNMVADGTYTLPNGTERRGPTCDVNVAGTWFHDVGEGSVILIKDAPWWVSDIEKSGDDEGYAVFELLEGADAIDFRYSAICPSCNALGGWNGAVSTNQTPLMIRMSCPRCAKMFAHTDDRIVRKFSAEIPPDFVPGRDMPEAEDL